MDDVVDQLFNPPSPSDGDSAPGGYYTVKLSREHLLLLSQAIQLGRDMKTLAPRKDAVTTPLSIPHQIVTEEEVEVLIDQ